MGSTRGAPVPARPGGGAAFGGPGQGAGVALAVVSVAAVSPHRVLLELKVPSQRLSHGASQGDRERVPGSVPSRPWTLSAPCEDTGSQPCSDPVTCAADQTDGEGGAQTRGQGPICPCLPRKCVSVCPLGYFGDPGARRCHRCHRGCETCSGRSPAQCLSCRRGLYHHQETSTCVALCPSGFYADESKCASLGRAVKSRAPLPGLGSPLLVELPLPSASCGLCASEKGRVCL